MTNVAKVAKSLRIGLSGNSSIDVIKLKKNIHTIAVGIKKCRKGVSQATLNALDYQPEIYMKKTTTTITAKRVAIAVAAVCASLSMPAVASDSKALLDLMLKKGVITQADYDQYLQSDAFENEKFKEKRTSDDVSKAVTFIQKQSEFGRVQKSGLGIQSGDGKYSATLTGRVHMDYRNFDPSTAASQGVDGFSLRRARVGLKGNLTKDFDYFIFGDFSSEKDATLDEGYLTYIGNKAAQVRVGKFKMPFSLEQLTSSNNIDFMERSLVGNDDKELIPGKQYGAMLFGSPMSGLSYGVALSSGNYHKAADASTTDNTDAIGRLAANLAELSGNKDMITHVGFGYSKGKVDSDFEYGGATEGKGISKFLTTNSSAQAAGSSRTRQNLEAALAYGPVKVQAEYFDFEYTKTASQKLSGYYIAGVWNITGESHNYSNSSNTFGWVKPKNEFSTEKGGLGAWQLGLRLSQIESDYLTTSSSTTNRADALTYGLTWIANSNVRFMLNYVKTNFASQVRSTLGETAINARAQVSF